jgi:hypothetical protein
VLSGDDAVQSGAPPRRSPTNSGAASATTQAPTATTMSAQER